MILFKEKARTHWKKHFPKLARQLEKEGTLEEELTEVAEQASKALAARLNRGEQLEAAKSAVMQEYILIDPETTE
jgi:hypothetical protein